MSAQNKVIKQKVQSIFKLNGLQLRQDSSKYLADLLSAVQDSHDRDQWIQKILNQVQKQKLESAVIELDIVEKAVQEVTADDEEGDENKNTLNIINAFDVPRFTYSIDRKKFMKDEVMGREVGRLLPAAGIKNRIFLDRYTAIQQRTSRHDLFSTTKGGTGDIESSSKNVEDKKKYLLKPVKFLLGTVERLDSVIVLGMLTQMTHGSYFLEDPSGVVKLDLTETKFHTGLYTENSFVLAEGWFDDEIFHVLALGFPPAEKSSVTRQFFGNTNFFGGPFDHTVKISEKLAAAESNNPDAMFIFVSDLWLDEPEVVVRLHRLFAGFVDIPPTAFVFCGNFIANCQSGVQYNNALKEHLKQLGEIICRYPEIRNNSRFMFIPGPSDPGSAVIYPRPPLPSHLTKDLKELVPNAEFLSNPARIQYCTQEIVVFREDVITKMCRNAVYFDASQDISEHVARTLCCQGHLAPLPLHTAPIYWDFDRSLSLYPLPDLVVVADKFKPFTAQHLDCQVVNPGSFQRQDFSFKTYVPNTRTVEDSQIPAQFEEMDI
jgi:DNA polymerase epsilon subunit 2